MTTGDNRLQRAERRALQREDEKYLSQPLNPGPDPRSISAHVRHVVRLFSNPSEDSPCATAMAHLGALYSRTVPKAQVACRRGCSSCCSQLVSVTAPEALWVADTIRRRARTVEKLRAADAATHHLSIEERLKSHLVCPLLEDDVCSIYASRPLGCRHFVSINLDACIATFVHGAEPQIPMPVSHTDVLYAIRMALYAAMRLKGLKDAAYELNAAVMAALAYEDAEARWLAGEDIFADVPGTRTIPPNFEQAISQLVAHIAPTV
ncbi:MAG: YkgJ family cysteine cluster protein [Rhodospirillaceae bacterium]|nr:YkgJ family cysteine cluster protein [Rhodospirillaceae bacterium]